MAASLADPLVIASVVLAAAGAGLLAQARMQARLLRSRIAAGSGTTVIDPATGLYAPRATWQCLRAEASRAARLQRPLRVWIGTADDSTQLDEAGRDLAFAMPAGATGIRLHGPHLCIVSCAGPDSSPTGLVDGIAWSSREIAPGDEAASMARAFVAEVTGDA